MILVCLPCDEEPPVGLLMDGCIYLYSTIYEGADYY